MGEAQLDLFERLLRQLDLYASTVTREELELDFDTWLKVSRALELAAQCAVDLAMQIVARRGLGLPESYRETFGRLSSAGIITTEDAKQLAAWAGLRNVLAHTYASIDLDRLFAALKEDKAALRRFGRVAAAELLAD